MIRRQLMTHLQVKEWDRKKPKRSFWASDCLRPACDIYWKWMGEDETNPIEPEKLLLMRVGKLYEDAICQELTETGTIVSLEDEKRISELGLTLLGDQFRVEMEREYVPITGYMDAVHVEGFPIEIKTHGSQAVDSQLENGKPPSEHYCHQIAVYMDYMGVDKGIIISANRANGKVFESEVIHLGNRCYECKGYSFALDAEYKRWRKIMEENIITMKEPDLDYFYHPEVTRDLLDKYPVEKIKKAIKGERILSDHRWRYQYSSYKEKIIQKEADIKGVSVDELCMYTDEEVGFMMDYLDVEWKQTKRGMQLYKKKVKK